jgi:hypothetical protein
MRERVALIYHFPPSELDALDLDDLETWAELAEARLEQQEKALRGR